MTTTTATPPLQKVARACRATKKRVARPSCQLLAAAAACRSSSPTSLFRAAVHIARLVASVTVLCVDRRWLEDTTTTTTPSLQLQHHLTVGALCTCALLGLAVFTHLAVAPSALGRAADAAARLLLWHAAILGVDVALPAALSRAADSPLIAPGPDAAAFTGRVPLFLLIAAAEACTVVWPLLWPRLRATPLVHLVCLGYLWLTTPLVVFTWLASSHATVRALFGWSVLGRAVAVAVALPLALCPDAPARMERLRVVFGVLVLTVGVPLGAIESGWLVRSHAQLEAVNAPAAGSLASHQHSRGSVSLQRVSVHGGSPANLKFRSAVDAMLMELEAALFSNGGAPALSLRGLPMQTAVVNALGFDGALQARKALWGVLSAAYLSCAPVVSLTVFLVLVLRGVRADDARRRVLPTVMLAFTTCWLLHIVAPAFGPLFTLNSRSCSGLSSRDLAARHIGAAGAFPSQPNGVAAMLESSLSGEDIYADAIGAAIVAAARALLAVSGTSFPSAHCAAACAVTLSFWIPTRAQLDSSATATTTAPSTTTTTPTMPSPRIIGHALAAYTAVLSVAAVWAGYHYVVDVAAGLAVGLCARVFVALVSRRAAARV